MFYAGCRLGEVAALRVSDVDFAAHTIRVAPGASPGLHGELLEAPTKGRRVRAMPRAAPMLPVVSAVIAGKEPRGCGGFAYVLGCPVGRSTQGR